MTNIEHAVEAARHDGDFGVMFLARAVGDLQKQIEQLPQQRTLPQAERAAWVELTDEDWDEVLEDFPHIPDINDFKKIEAKLKEKNT